MNEATITVTITTTNNASIKLVEKPIAAQIAQPTPPPVAIINVESSPKKSRGELVKQAIKTIEEETGLSRVEVRKINLSEYACRLAVKILIPEITHRKSLGKARCLALLFDRGFRVEDVTRLVGAYLFAFENAVVMRN